VSAASPAVLITFAVVDAVYSFATPGVNAPNVAGAPSVSDSVAGTAPPTGWETLVDEKASISPYGTSRTGPSSPVACRARPAHAELPGAIRTALSSVVATLTSIAFVPAFRYGPTSMRLLSC